MNPIGEAREFVMSTVQNPALMHPDLSQEIKHKVRSSNVWLSKFTRVGDLFEYLQRFDAKNGDPIYQEMKQHGLQTYEDIVGQFEDKFANWTRDRTRPSDFVIGHSYNVYEILIFAKSYDTRSGGMFVLSAGEIPEAVVVKATLNGGAYPNEWLSKPRRLKYFLKAMAGKFGEHFKPNAAIIANSAIPVLTFVRETDDDDFTYFGVFHNHALHTEPNGSKWFELDFAVTQPVGVVAEETTIHAALAIAVLGAQASTREARLARLKIAPKKPARLQMISTGFDRNPDVIAEALFLADGICGGCGKSAPFLRASDQTPYLEVHHRVPLAAGGYDTVENAISLCPNCHRRSHYGA